VTGVRWTLRCAVVATVCLIGSLVLSAEAVSPPRAGAATDPTSLVGEGGSFLTPVTDVLLKADPGLAPLNPTYSDSNLDNAISDFVGTSPANFAADFVVSERPLTSSEAATAKKNGRGFAYIPFAATPVGIATLAVCNPSDLVTGTPTPSTFCNNMPLTAPLVAGIFTDGLTSTSVQPNSNLPTGLQGWKDPRLTQSDGTSIPDGDGIAQASTLSPSAENSALMAYLDSDPTAKEEFDNAVANPANNADQSNDTPSETWPFHGNHAYIGGDEGLIGRELTINAETNAPAALASWGGLGADGSSAHDAFPVSAVWTGAPLGTPWNIPTAAIQNAQGSFVAPTEKAAAASEADATLDPATNLVTFNAKSSDAAAYNNYLMVESYLVVPTSGLPSEKAEKLAQLIRFVLGPTAQSDESTLGAAPATPAMDTAGLAVADQLDSSAATTTAVGTSTSPTSTTATTAPAGSASNTGSPSGVPATASSTTVGDSSSQDLAFTGSSGLVPLVGVGAFLVLVGALVRRRLRHTKVGQ
jgi:ABC-type phosphate transport system substrate-binding protein